MIEPNTPRDEGGADFTTTKFNHSVKVPIQYKTAARFLKTNFEKGVSLKELIFKEKHAWKNPLFGLISRIAKHKADLDRVIAESHVAELEPRLDKYLSLVLMTELLFGTGQLIGHSKPVECIRRYEAQFRELLSGNQWLVEAPVDGEAVKKRPVKEFPKPRYVRINTNAMSRADAIEQFTKDGYVELSTADCKTYDSYLEIVRKLDTMEYVSDIHVKNLFVFAPQSKRFWAFHDLVKDSRVILQDKASCLPAMLLDPPRGATVLDMCAAPGMKSSHLASILKNKGLVYAIEKDMPRYQRLCNFMRQSKSNAVQTLNDDSLGLRSDAVPGVQYILVDPSCSGSGMTSRLFGTEEHNLAERLVSLSGYQAKILQHAMREFPQAQRIVYSTCSVYEEENEQVVHRSLEACPEWELIKPIEFAEMWKNFGSAKWKHVGKKCIYARADVDLTDGFFVALFQRRPEEGVDNYYRTTSTVQTVVADQNGDQEYEEEFDTFEKRNPFGNRNVTATSQTSIKGDSYPKESTLESVTDQLENGKNSSEESTEKKNKKKKKKSSEEYLKRPLEDTDSHSKESTTESVTTSKKITYDPIEYDKKNYPSETTVEATSEQSTGRKIKKKKKKSSEESLERCLEDADSHPKEITTESVTPSKKITEEPIYNNYPGETAEEVTASTSEESTGKKIKKKKKQSSEESLKRPLEDAVAPAEGDDFSPVVKKPKKSKKAKE